MPEPPPAVPHPDVLAVVVSAGVTPYLPETLQGLAVQRTPPAAVLVVDVEAAHPGRTTALRSLAKDAGLPLERVRIAHAPQARTFGDGVRAGLDQLAGQGAGGPDLAQARWIWLLHDDSAPEPGALAALLRAAEAGPSVALVGSKQRDWWRPDRLLSVGVTVTPGGRRFTGIDEGELDQGQHDGREDVYGAGTAGALVRREVWAEVGGTDPALGPFRDGLDLSRRVRLAGYRVVVAPRAVVRHARASYLGLRPGQAPKGPGGTADDGAPRPDPRRSFRARRVALLHSRLAAAPPAALPFIVLAAVLAAVVRAVVRVVTKEPRLAGDELAAAAGVLARPAAVRRSRDRARAGRRLAGRLRPLRAGYRDVWEAARDRHFQAATNRRARANPSQIEIAERRALASRRRGGLVAVVVLLVGVALAAFGPLLGAGGLTGGALLPTDADLGHLWQRALGSWVAAADGLPGPNDPLLAVLAVPTALVGGSAEVAVAVLLLGAIPLAGVGAWYAAGAATRGIGRRVIVALVWALAPALVLGVGQGRLGAVVAHLALPWVALGVVRALGVHRRDPAPAGAPGAGSEDEAAGTVPPAGAVPDHAGAVAAAAGGGLALAIAAAGAPVLLPAGVLGLALVAAVAPARRAFLWLAAIPPVALLGPLVAEALADPARGSWRILFADPGVPLAADPGSPYLALLAWPTEPFAWPFLPEPAAGLAPLAATGAVAVGALLALARPARWRAAVAGWFLVACGVAAALAASRVEVALGAGDEGAAFVTGWAGPGTSVVLAGLLVAALAGADGVPLRLGGGAGGRWRAGAAGLAALAVLALALGALAWVWRVAEARTSGDTAVLALTGREAAVPALGRELQRPPQQARVLAVEPVLAAGPGLAGESGVGGLVVRLWRVDGDQLDERSVSVAARAVTGPPGAVESTPLDAAETALAHLVAAMSVGAADNPSEDLARHAVAVVVVPPGDGREDLVARFDATTGLERVTENATGTVWRVAPPEGSALVGRARVVSADGTVTAIVPSDGVSARGPVAAGEADRLLVLAERADAGWRAWLDGRPLRAETVGWQQAFALGADGGEVVVTHAAWRLTLAHTVQAVVFSLFALLALPLRRRRGEAV